MLPVNDTYALFNQKGEQLTDIFTQYDKNADKGYLVMNNNNQYAYINQEGEKIVNFNQYSQLTYADDMIIGTNEQSVDILNNKGKVINTINKDSYIESHLPIINTSNEYQVLYKNGDTLYKGNQKVIQTLFDDNYNIYIIVYENKTDVYYNDITISIPISGEFEIKEYKNNECLLYDEEAQICLYINVENQNYVQYNNIDTDNMYFDDNQNIIMTQNDTYSMLSKKEAKIISLNSYYQDEDHYLIRNTNVYGPHSLYITNNQLSLKDCQIYPSVELVKGKYFPIYIKEKGYQYIDWNNQILSNTYYYEAYPYDNNYVAIVKDKENSTYLIDKEGKQLTENKYFNIKYIGSSYYAVYNEDGKFGIVDKEGKEILSTEFTELNDTPIIHYNNKEYFMLSKNGRYYIIDTETNETIFSKEGTMEYNDDGYLKVNESYYTFNGELIR
jgi:hypothetical protein